MEKVTTLLHELAEMDGEERCQIMLDAAHHITILYRDCRSRSELAVRNEIIHRLVQFKADSGPEWYIAILMDNPALLDVVRDKIKMQLV